MIGSFLVAVLSVAAHAEPAPDEEKNLVKPMLLANVDAIAPGSSFRTGVYFEIQEGWHIYWINPGDAGLPTQAEWSGPEGFSFSKTLYPAPIFFGAGTELSGYGYEKEVLLMTEVKAPEKIEGGKVTLKAKASWLVCKNKCIPGQQDLSLALPVAEGYEAGAKSKLCEEWSARVPMMPDKIPGLSVSGLLGASGVTPDAAFDAAFVVKAPAGAQIAARSDAQTPAFSPFAPQNYSIEKIEYFPTDKKPVDELLVRIKAKAFPGDASAEKIGGVFQFDLLKGPNREPIAVAYEIDLPRAPAGSPVTSVDLPQAGGATAEAKAPAMGSQPAARAGGAKIILMILFALVGGVILNIMPCVLPVVSIKVLSLVRQANLSRQQIRGHGIAYTTGILASFLVLSTVVAILKSSGEAVGWGFQMQSPTFVSLLAACVFVFGLSLLGVFEIVMPGAQAIQKSEEAIRRTTKIILREETEKKGGHEGYSGSFASGIFATVLATPCTAPFLGAALGFAFSQPIYVTFAIFLSVGLGLSIPFLILAFVPAWSRFLPRPGDWMNTFKTVMGFLLMATVVWLLDVLGKQAGAPGLVRMTGLLALLGFAGWIYGAFGNIMKEQRTRLIASLAALVIAVAGAVVLLRFEPIQASQSGPIASREGGIPWERFSEKRVAELSAQGKTAFIDFTAAWCWTCKVNEKAVIETDEVTKAVKDLGVVALKGDWTNRDPEISAYLKKRGRAGVPLYVIVPPGQTENPIVLPEVVTKDQVIQALKKGAGK